MTSEQYLLAPHWLARWLGHRAATFTVTTEGLELVTADGACYAVLDESLTLASVVKKRRGFHALVLSTDQGRRCVPGVSRRDALAAGDWLRRYWYRQLAPSVRAVASRLSRELGEGYLRTSRWQSLQGEALHCAARFCRMPPADVLSDSEYQSFELVLHLAQWDEDDLAQWRQRYVKQMMQRYAGYFDQVESQPLTLSQREACVTDEDNNLVLAGAGTGKTSTMVGRAGFLLHSGQAEPGQLLMLAFARKAAAEMQQRLTQRLGAEGIAVHTFHALGMRIVAQVEGASPNLSALASDETLLAERVGQWFEQSLRAPAYQTLLLEYVQHYYYGTVSPFDFASRGAYYEQLQASAVRTWQGEQVSGVAVAQIANHLFRLGIDYVYQQPYEYPVLASDYRPYRPDFYLPQYGVYLEHLVVDHSGATAAFSDRHSYHQRIAWQREQHRQHQTCLIESYEYQQREGTLLSALEEQLQAVGVTVQPRPIAAVLDTLRACAVLASVTELLATLLRRYRACAFDPEQMANAIERAEQPRQLRSALALLQPIIARYDDELAARAEIDFDEMISRAIAYVEQGRFHSPWQHILVDEFQDISAPRARLIRALRDSVARCALFCVGDDWQAIYRFTGSDLSFTTDFAEHFGHTQVTMLDKTFRFNNRIGELASRFVLHNPLQLPKQLSSHIEVDDPAVALLWTEQASSGQVDPLLERVLHTINGMAEQNSSVLLLARYRFALPAAEVLEHWGQCFERLAIDAMSVHSAKGKEADYVVVLGLRDGAYGFPSRQVTHPLLEALLPEREPFADAEERRLFYVALTRARHRVYLIADRAAPSAFVTELLEHDYVLSHDELTSDDQQHSVPAHVPCSACGSGTLVARQGRSGTFYGCSHFPLCRHSEQGCPECGQLMQRQGRFEVCCDDSCTGWLPLCPRCGGRMSRREGRRGSFWGCVNFRGDEAASCQHTEPDIEYVAQAEI